MINIILWLLLNWKVFAQVRKCEWNEFHPKIFKRSFPFEVFLIPYMGKHVWFSSLFLFYLIWFCFWGFSFLLLPLHVWSSCDLVLHFTFSTILIYTSVSSTIFPTSVYLKFFWFFHSYDLLRLKIHSWKNGIHSIILPGVDFFLLHFHLHFWFFSKIFSHFTYGYTYYFNKHNIAI